MSLVTVHVALLHDGKVLADDGARLPSITVDEDDEQNRCARVLDLVGADIYLAPTLKVGDNRHLDVVGCRALTPPEGRWLEPDDLRDPSHARLVARTLQELPAPPRLRPAWFRSGWYDEVEAWVDAALERAGRRRTGRMRPAKMWSISGVLRIPTDSGDVWFKAAGEVFHAEAAIHRVVSAHHPDLLPVLIAEDDRRAWLLMEPLRGAGDADRVPGAARLLARRWGQLQLSSLDFVDELVAAGSLVRGGAETAAAFRKVLDASPELRMLSSEDLDAVRGVQQEVEDAIAEFWACGLPDTLCHGDLHLGNVAYDGETLRVFDWTDACLTHPFLDGCHLAMFDAVFDSSPPDEALLQAFAEPWRSAHPDAKIDRALQLAPVVDLAFQADTFDRIVAATEPASAYELGGTVAWLLRRLPEAVARLR